jgi:dipeptidyl aminopeptidase/acylaminoacyl peptidase
MNFYGVANLLTRQETEKDGTPIGKLKTGGAAKVFGAKSATDDIYRLVSPVTYVTKDSPPMLTLHGRADATVDYPQAEELDAVAKARGARHELVLLDGVGHTFDLTTWNRKPLPRDLRPVVLDFLAQHLAPARR